MNSPEEIQKAALAAEMAGMEKMPEAPEMAADFENIESYAENAEVSIDAQANDFASEIKAAENPDTFGLSDEAVGEIRSEQNVGDELGKIKSEADEVLKTAKAEIDVIIKEKESGSESGDQESIASTGSVIEEETASQRIDDDARYRKLTEDLSLQYLKEKDSTWFHQNYSGEVAPSGYLLDRNGKETNFLPSQNIAVGYDKIKSQAKTEFEKMYPEDAKRYAGNETIAVITPKETISQPPSVAVMSREKNEVMPSPIEQPEQAKETAQHELQKVFEQMGIESKTISIEDGGEFSEVIFLSKREVPAEKTVRVFRGVNHVDASILSQTPYAMRTENQSGKAGVIEGVKLEVEALAHHPTYENLMVYVNKMRPELSNEERRRMDYDLQRIEDGVLNGESVRKELIWKQIEHGGGVADSGISPYVSGSYDAAEATAYIRNGEGALVVMDIPISQIEDFRADATEVNIKGQLDQKYVTAILPRTFSKDTDPDKMKQNIDKALAKIAEVSQTPAPSETEVRATREQQLAEEQKQDAEQWKIDVELVRRRRAEVLIKKFPEVKIDMSPSGDSTAESSVDVYAKVKIDIFDYYADRMGKVGKGDRRPEDYDFSESGVGERRKPFDKENVTDVMLLRLRELVENLEDRAAERARNR